MSKHLHMKHSSHPTHGTSSRVFVIALVGMHSALLMGPAYANPGLFYESRREQRTVAPSPEVQKVKQALHDQVRNNWFEVSIEDQRDALVLRGEVDSEEGRQRVLGAARSVIAKPIKDELRIRQVLTDDQIATQLRATLEKEYPTLSNRITVNVKEGTAYFSGNLRSHREVDEVLATALMQEGLRNIESEMTCSGRPYPRRHVAKRKY